MADNTIIQQGRFTGDGTAHQLEIRSDLDWIRTFNETIIIAAAGGDAEFYFQRGMTNGRGILYAQAGGVTQIAASAGFSLLDTSGNPLLAAVATTDASNVVRPIILTADTAGLVAGDVVRLSLQATDDQLNGYDFTIDTISANTSFRLASPLANAGGAGGVQGGFYRKINFDPLYFPRHRFIADISQAASAVITLTVQSGYAVGQEVRILVPDDSVAGASVYGMTEMNNLLGTITAINDAIATQTITVDIDSTNFTAFSFPTAAQAANALRKAMVVPVGMDTAQAITSSVNLLSDATDNRGFIGVELASGASSPAGVNADVIYWVAGKSFSVSNL